MGTEFIGEPGFEAVYDAYKDLVFQTAYLYLKDWHEAEDIMQETLSGATTIYMEHTKVENTRKWLLTAAKNMALNHIRIPAARTSLGMEEDEEGSLGSEESSEDIFFARLWRREVIRSADTILGALYRKAGDGLTR